MASTGRRKDPVWNYFLEIKPNGTTKGTRAKCIKCNFEMSGLVDRMKTHLNKSNVASISNDVQIDEELGCFDNNGM